MIDKAYMGKAITVVMREDCVEIRREDKCLSPVPMSYTMAEELLECLQEALKKKEPFPQGLPVVGIEEWRAFKKSCDDQGKEQPELAEARKTLAACDKKEQLAQELSTQYGQIIEHCRLALQKSNYDYAEAARWLYANC